MELQEVYIFNLNKISISKLIILILTPITSAYNNIWKWYISVLLLHHLIQYYLIEALIYSFKMNNHVQRLFNCLLEISIHFKVAVQTYWFLKILFYYWLIKMLPTFWNDIFMYFLISILCFISYLTDLQTQIINN